LQLAAAEQQMQCCSAAAAAAVQLAAAQQLHRSSAAAVQLLGSCTAAVQQLHYGSCCALQQLLGSVEPLAAAVQPADAVQLAAAQQIVHKAVPIALVVAVHNRSSTQVNNVELQDYMIHWSHEVRQCSKYPNSTTESYAKEGTKCNTGIS
jgi:hypothetical protein